VLILTANSEDKVANNFITLRYRLRTLFIVLALGPPAIYLAWSRWEAATKAASDPPILLSPNRPDLIVYWLEHPSEAP
jgi:hypothetical protein